MKKYIKSAILSLNDHDWHAIQDIVEDSNTSVETLAEIAERPIDDYIATAIVRNLNSTPEIWNTLANTTHFSYSVALEITYRENALPKTLAAIAEHYLANYNAADRRILLNVACHPNTPLSALRKLANCGKYDILCAVAGNSEASTSLLNQLIKIDPDVIEEVVRNPHVDKDLLIKYAKSSKNSVREGIASNPKTPPNILSKLALDKDKYVRGAVARNRNTPISDLVDLASDTKWYDVYTGARYTLRCLGIVVDPSEGW